MSKGPFYTKDEDELILHLMGELKNTRYSGKIKRFEFISESYLPHRTPVAIRQRWEILIGKRIDPQTIIIKDVADLLSPEQRKRFKVRLPTFKNYIDPRTGRRV